MIPILCLQPTAEGKRRHSARKLVRPRGDFWDLEAVKQELGDLRLRSCQKIGQLADRFQRRLSAEADVYFTSAGTAAEAAEAISTLSRPSRNIAINRSAVVGKELAPLLAQAGFRIIETYPPVPAAFTARFSQYWELPSLLPEAVGFSLERVGNLAGMRRASIHRDGVKDFVAVLGVSAAAADGALLFLQHFDNITRLFEQARKVILVVAPDKLTESAEEAIFQTRCLALFGAPALLLDLSRAEPPSGAFALEELPFEYPDPSAEEVHIILLDNGRTRLLESPYRELMTCIGCRACIQGCPTYQLFKGPLGWSPREYLFFFLLGDNPSLDLCLSCALCRHHCPLSLDLPGMIIKARAERLRGERFRRKVFGNVELMGRLGSAAPGLVNPLLRSRSLRRLGGIAPSRQLPRFRADTAAKWFRRAGGRFE